MATFLYRLGRLSFRRRRLVVAAWLMLLVAAGLGAATLSGTTTDSFTIPGSSSQQALDQLVRKFPQAAAGGALQLARSPGMPHQISVISGVREDEARRLSAIAPAPA